MTAPTSAPVKVFVAERGNGFMADIASMIHEAASCHRDSEVVTTELPADDGSINLVVAPHEFFELTDAPPGALQRAAAVSICIGTEQPDTPWFHLGADACRRGLLTLDINELAVEALRGYGIPTERLRLGAVASMDVSDIDAEVQARRPIDVLFMGGLDDRRGRILAGLGSTLFERSCDLRLFKFDRPIGPWTPGVVFGAAKYELLARSRVLVNIHRDSTGETAPYFEWVRMIEAMANGCVVVTEPSTGHEPLLASEHFVETDEAAVAETLLTLLDDADRLREIAVEARRQVCETLGLANAIGPVLDLIEATVLPGVTAHLASGASRRGPWRFRGEVTNPVRRLGPLTPYADVQRRAKQLALADGRMLQRIDALCCVVHHGSELHVERMTTPAYDTVAPSVTAVVTVYNYARVVAETLDSIAASTDVDLEIVIVDDHATDDSRAVVVDWMQRHPQTPALLLGKDANQGLAAARNLGFTEARGAFVMVMDADNHVYPTCLARLRETLETVDDAAAAYAILEDFGDARNVRSAIDWDPHRLCEANYIDAQAMWRRTMWDDLGGYRSDDDMVYGWEDWDLWLRLADRGGHAVLRREILGRYRVQQGSMIALTNLATADAIDAIRARYPTLPWPDDAA